MTTGLGGFFRTLWVFSTRSRSKGMSSSSLQPVGGQRRRQESEQLYPQRRTLTPAVVSSSLSQMLVCNWVREFFCCWDSIFGYLIMLIPPVSGDDDSGIPSTRVNPIQSPFSPAERDGWWVREGRYTKQTATSLAVSTAKWFTRSRLCAVTQTREISDGPALLALFLFSLGVMKDSGCRRSAATAGDVAVSHRFDWILMLFQRTCRSDL
ncbi:hypothetical protein QBC35DRAFT_480280 [Podospora australis]|uniref:Uncharacterized protein n=1 Tax=Podospora australis TaxID=1536484 RepID=A0AAN7ANN2_9PEZI|nr:hypothetical protein QBC35DRAFT_480280 [Podospora australis]